MEPDFVAWVWCAEYGNGLFGLGRGWDVHALGGRAMVAGGGVRAGGPGDPLYDPPYDPQYDLDANRAWVLTCDSEC